MDDEGVRMFIDALHGMGVLLAVIKTPGRWAGICHDSADRYWLVEGDVTSTDDIQENGLRTTDHCYRSTYDEALEEFRIWWDRGFVGSPCGSECGTGLKPI